MNITSAGGILSLLQEPSPELRTFALIKLNLLLDEHWPEISEAIEEIEINYETLPNVKERQLPALLASRVYYHLGSYSDSMNYALGAGDLFDVNTRSEYVDTITTKCIDHYAALKVQNEESPSTAKPIDERLVNIIDRLFTRSLEEGHFRQTLGIALMTRRMDIFEKAIMLSDDKTAMLQYAFQVSMSFLQNRAFRNQVLRTLVSLYHNLDIPDFVNMVQCLIFLDDSTGIAQLLEKLCKDTETSTLMSFQLAFDIYESATQQLVGRILQAVTATAPIPSLAKAVFAHSMTSPVIEGVVEPSSETADKTLDDLSEAEKIYQTRIQKLIKILSGEVTIELHLQFLIRSNHTDMMILKNTKDAIRVSVCHTATVIENFLMHAGTTSDQFLRENLEWLARATNWSKLLATASLGVIHRGHESQALALMSTYLPNEPGPSSGYSEGGGLYALGLIHANHGASIIDYLLQQLIDAKNDVIRHGGCLGLGLAAMGTHRSDVYNQLKTNLYQDDAVTGEAASIAMGLVMLGSKSTLAVEDMVSYAAETQHEKILRGLAVGIALVMYGRLEEADPLIASLMADKDPVLRRSAMYTISMAYCGTGSNKAIEQLLHVAVSDVNDDVRRAAVIGLGFLLFRTPEQCPSVVSLLAESYNPHVRYGAAMALGIACGGTGLKEAIALLDPMTNDSMNFVRQGALIASSMILIQQTEQTCPKVKDFKALYAKVIQEKHDDIMAKFGAILAQGIIDAGGRNVTFSLESRTGHTNMLAVVGTLVFLQHWFWYQLTPFLALAFTPTCVIGLNKDLKMPKIMFKSNAKPSTYAYPNPLEEKKREEREKITTAVLSIAARARRRGNASRAESRMEVDEEKKEEEKEKKEQQEKKEQEKKEPEPNFELLPNPARVMKAQLKHLSLMDNCPYTPLKDVTIGGIIMLNKTSDEAEDEIVEPVMAFGPKADDEKEPEAPEDFEYTED